MLSGIWLQSLPFFEQSQTSLNVSNIATITSNHAKKMNMKQLER